MGIPIQSLAESDGIFFNISTAKKIAADIDYYKTSKTSSDVIILQLKEVNTKLETMNTEFQTKIVGLEADKVVFKDRGDKFEGVYATCTKSLQKCEDNKPSRFVWFSGGVISTLALMLSVLLL